MASDWLEYAISVGVGSTSGIVVNTPPFCENVPATTSVTPLVSVEPLYRLTSPLT
jgi:hypothetical protein